jgi:hypothetical protein
MENGTILAPILTFLVIHVFYAFPLARMAKRTGEDDVAWMAWVPVANVFLMLRIAEKPNIWFLLLFIPFINIIIAILIHLGISRRFGVPTWAGILSLFLGPLMPFYYLYLAYGTEPPPARILEARAVEPAAATVDPAPTAAASNPQAVDYATQCKAAGMGVMDVRRTLLAQGWDQATVDASLAEVYPGFLPPQA